MSKKGLLITLVIGIIIIVAAFVWSRTNSTIPPGPGEVKDHTGWVTYHDPNGIYELSYPNNFLLTGREPQLTNEWHMDASVPGLVLARVVTPANYMPKTNFSEGKLILGWSNNPEAIKNCTATNDNLPNTSRTNATVNSIPFIKTVTSDAAAGNRYDTTSYRAILDGDCYSLEYTIHSTNIGNYDPSQGIKEYDQAKVVSDFEGMVQSFKFLVNSD